VTTVVSDVRRGAGYWVDSYLRMVRWELTSLRMFVPLTVFVQIVIGAGFALGVGMFVGDLPPRGALYLATGLAVVTLVTVGLVLGPQLIANQKEADTYDFLWSLPVPRTTAALAWFTVTTIIGVPGMVAAVWVADLRYGLDIHVTPAVIPAVLVVTFTATMIGYAIAHAVPNPMATQLTTQVLIFVILGFAPINFPPEQLPGWLASVNEWLPFVHMATVMRGALTDGLVDDVGTAYAVLGAYAVASVAVTAWVLGRRS
jgi:ABC-2 type transport system permease protein